MNNNFENIFFYSACQGLIKEDERLRELFLQNTPKYAKQHNGISCLYETTMVYCVFKQLLHDRFPLEVMWEYPYPNQNHLKSDLGLLNEDGSINSLIEFKIWLSEDGCEIHSDYVKYRDCEFSGDKYLFVIELNGGNIDKNAEYLSKQNSGLKLIKKELFSTLFFLTSKNSIDYVPVNIYFLKA